MAQRTDKSIDKYIAACSPKARSVLRKIRSTVRKAAPAAEETISYRMPAFRQHGMLLYVAAFKNHIGLFPPVRGDIRLDKALARFRGPKGNLRFPLDEPIPYRLIERIVKLRVRQDLAKPQAKAKRKR
jgi:uncharacterized protein YdhG (YjbR/CyaY superfamily)